LIRGRGVTAGQKQAETDAAEMKYFFYKGMEQNYLPLILWNKFILYSIIRKKITARTMFWVIVYIAAQDIF
jgi:hypothetical protein